MRRDVVFGLTVVALLGAGGPRAVSAAPPVDKRNTQGVELFQQGKFREAAEIYAQLREETGNAKYSCNLGLCYSKMGFLEPAIETVRHCLDNAVLGAVTRSEYQDLLAKLEAQRSQTAAAPPGATAPPPVEVPLVPLPVPAAPAPGVAAAPEAVPAPAWPSATPPAVEPAPPAPAAPPIYYPPPPVPMNPGQPSAGAPPAAVVDNAPRGKRRVPFGSYATGAVGLVSGAMGIALVLHSQAIQQELDGSTMVDADRQLLENDKSRAKKGATAAFIIGGLGLGASIVWAIVAPSYTKPTLAGVPLDVAVGPRAVGVGGRF